MDAIQAYRESELSGDNPLRLVVLLYDQLLRDLQRALDALEKRDIPRRCHELDHALIVLAQLQGTLNLESGGEVAESLDRFYNLVRDNLLRASLDGSSEVLEKQWQQILGVREAWLEVEDRQAALFSTNDSSLAKSHPDDCSRQGSSEWKV